MLAAVPVHELLEGTKTNEVLCGRLLSINNNIAFVDNDSIYTVIVVDETDAAKPVAFGAFQICSKSQAYFILNECDPKYTNKNVLVEELAIKSDDTRIDNKKAHCCLKIVEVSDPEVDYAYLPQYYGAFGKRYHQSALAHIYDTLAAMSIQLYNMDVAKNITIDLYNFESFSDGKKIELRDRLGLMVTNNCSLYEITVKKSVLHNLLKDESAEEAHITYEEVDEKNIDFVLDYDSTTSLYNRQDYMEFLLRIKEIRGLVAIEVGQPVGYILTLNDRILQCYADNESIARGLIREILTRPPMVTTSTLTMFIRHQGEWLSPKLIDSAQQLQKVHRYHSRVVPSQVKWSNIYIMNIGLYLY